MLTLRNAEKSDCEVKTKKQKIPTNEEPFNCPNHPNKTELLALDDDCIESICVRLQLKDLCSFSLTCKRIHKVANRHFYRQYKSHHMEIVNTLAGPQNKTKELYGRCFKSNIRNIRITSDYFNLGLTSLFTFLRNNCLENLRSLEFNTIDLGPNQPKGNCIMDQLTNLEAISFINCSKYDIYEGFLRYCKRLKHLVVKEEMETEINCDWMSHVYPNLKTLAYSDRTKLDKTSLLLTLFQLNPHIKRLAISDPRIINCIANSEITLDRLNLCLEEIDSLTEILKILNILCCQKRVHQLRLEFGYRFKQKYPTLLSGIVYLGPTSLFVDAVSFKNETTKIYLGLYHSFENVKYLSFETGQPTGTIMMCDIANNYSNLMEIHLHSLLNTIVDNFQSCIGVAVEKLKKLETIVVYQISAMDIGENSIIDLNFKRMCVIDACPLTIYLPYEVTQKSNLKIPDSSMVFVKPISSLEREIPLCDIRFI